jgi:hypothetical protein
MIVFYNEFEKFKTSINLRKKCFFIIELIFDA